jgi:hypothetical protein
MAGLFSVTCKELPILMRELRRADPELAKSVKRRIREAEAPAKRAMVESATNAGMMKAARAVKVSNRYSGKAARLTLRVDAKIAPNARPLDKPNRGGFNRHPVFGSGLLTRDKWHWVDQPARRFFDRGADAGFRACEQAMGDALDDLVKYLAG